MALSSLKKLRRRLPQELDAAGMLREIRSTTSDRGAVLLTGAFVDAILKSRLYHAMPNRAAADKLFEDRAPLSTFSGKIAMAHALALFGDETRRNLDIIREIRNLFAHEVSTVNFETQELIEACEQLRPPTPHPIVARLRFEFGTPRERYVHTAMTISLNLLWNMMGTLFKDEPNEVMPEPLP